MGDGVLKTYKDLLPVTAATPMITLGEGDTPLVKSSRLGRELGCEQLYFKLEGCNPTGSFKDRGMVVAIAKALEEGSRAVMCASTGNTSASAAAYAARYGLRSIVIVPKGEVAAGKLAQATAYGSKLVSLDGNFDEALDIVRDMTSRHPIALVNSLNPNRIEGQKTAAFEIIESMGGAPDFVFVPVGNAGNITAYWMGFTEARDMAWAASRPSMMGFQAAGAAPIVRGAPVEEPETVASAIRVGNPASWQSAIAARDESGGTIGAVSDGEIMEAYRLMAQEEGVFCEPAAAAPVAGLLKLAGEGLHLRGKRAVCIVTGTGLKDPDSADRLEAVAMEEYPAEIEALERALIPA
jgi:threonine synthase